MTIFVDLETSGLSPQHGAAILSFGLVADGGTLTSTISELEVNVIPTEEQWAQASPQALEVNGLTLEFLHANGAPFPAAIDQVCAWLAAQRVWLGTEIVGQNPDFDDRFLRHFMLNELQCAGFPIERDDTNVIDLAKEQLTKDKTFRLPPNPSGRPSFKGASISLALGLEPEPAIHKAIGGG